MPVPDKIVVKLTSIGNAPMLKQSLFKVSTANQWSHIVLFIQKQLGTTDLFVYVNSSFCPRLDEPIVNLLDFCTDGTLVVQYSLSSAWG